MSRINYWVTLSIFVFSVVPIDLILYIYILYYYDYNEFFKVSICLLVILIHCFIKSLKLFYTTTKLSYFCTDIFYWQRYFKRYFYQVLSLQHKLQILLLQQRIARLTFLRLPDQNFSNNRVFWLLYFKSKFSTHSRYPTQSSPMEQYKLRYVFNLNNWSL